MPSWSSHLPLSIRAAAPAPLRRALRAGRHLFTSGQPSMAIPPELLSACRVCASRNELVKQLPKQARVAEVGTYRGEFARHILSSCDPAELHLIDIDVSLR